MYHRKAKEEELDTPISYLRHVVQPFLQRLLDFDKIVPQYCAQNDRHGWHKLFPGDNKFASYSEVFPEFANGFEIVAPTIPWSILVPGSLVIMPRTGIKKNSTRQSCILLILIILAAKQCRESLLLL